VRNGVGLGDTRPVGGRSPAGPSRRPLALAVAILPPLPSHA
jgi:hypothetical protein